MAAAAAGVWDAGFDGKVNSFPRCGVTLRSPANSPDALEKAEPSVPRAIDASGENTSARGPIPTSWNILFRDGLRGHKF